MNLKLNQDPDLLDFKKLESISYIGTNDLHNELQNVLFFFKEVNSASCLEFPFFAKNKNILRKDDLIASDYFNRQALIDAFSAKENYYLRVNSVLN